MYHQSNILKKYVGGEIYKTLDTLTTNVKLIKTENNLSIIPEIYQIIPFTSKNDKIYHDIRNIFPKNIFFNNVSFLKKSLYVFEYGNIIHHKASVPDFIKQFEIKEVNYLCGDIFCPIGRDHEKEHIKAQYMPEYVLFSLNEKDFMVHLDISLSVISCLYTEKIKLYLYLENLEQYKLHNLLKNYANIKPVEYMDNYYYVEKRR